MRCFSKSFTSYLHNQSTLEHNLNRFWKLQFRATTFIVDLFLEFGHVTSLPMTYWLDSDRYNHLYVLFLHFLQYFSFWTSTPGPWMHHPTILTSTPNFFPIIPVFDLEMQMFPYLAMHVGPWKQCPPSIITNPSPFFSDFSVFYCHFSSRKAYFSIFGSVHWTLKEYPSIWQSSLLSLFYWYFSFSIATLFIFGNVCWTLNTMRNIVTNHPPFFPLFFRIFSPFYCYFSLSIAILSIFESVH